MWKGSKRKRSSFTLSGRGTTRRTFKQTRLTGKSKLKRDRIRKRQFALIGIVAMLVLVLVGLSFLSFSKKMAVREVTVSGQQNIHPLAIIARSHQYTAEAYMGLFSRQNIMLYPSKDLEQLLTFEFPRIETIDVKRHLFKRNVSIVLSERTPYALWCRQSEKKKSEEEAEDVVFWEECFLADRTGFLFGKASGTETLIRLHGGVKHPDGSMLRKNVIPEDFGKIVSLLTGLQEIPLRITHIRFDDDEVEVFMAPGWKLLLTLSKDISTVPINLSTVLDENELSTQLEALEYIDLRFDDRVYYRLRE